MDHQLILRDESRDKLLVCQAQAGDREAFDQLTQRHRLRLGVAAFARTGDREAAEDLVQEVLAQAWQQLRTLRAPDAFAGWLKMILLHHCSTWHRRFRLSTSPLLDELPLSARENDPLAHLLCSERQAEWRQALAKLSEQNRRVFVLHVLGGYSCPEIAGLLGIPLTTVEGRIHRTRQQLRRFIGEERPTQRLLPPYQQRSPEEKHHE